jgi:hypothetical protein
MLGALSIPRTLLCEFFRSRGFAHRSNPPRPQYIRGVYNLPNLVCLGAYPATSSDPLLEEGEQMPIKALSGPTHFALGTCETPQVRCSNFINFGLMLYASLVVFARLQAKSWPGLLQASLPRATPADIAHGEAEYRQAGSASPPSRGKV